MELKKEYAIRSNFTLPKYLVDLLSEYRDKKKITRSRLVAFLLDEHFKKELKEEYNKIKKENGQ